MGLNWCFGFRIVFCGMCLSHFFPFLFVFLLLSHIWTSSPYNIFNTRILHDRNYVMNSHFYYTHTPNHLLTFLLHHRQCDCVCTSLSPSISVPLAAFMCGAPLWQRNHSLAMCMNHSRCTTHMTIPMQCAHLINSFTHCFVIDLFSVDSHSARVRVCRLLAQRMRYDDAIFTILFFLSSFSLCR